MIRVIEKKKGVSSFYQYIVYKDNIVEYSKEVKLHSYVHLDENRRYWFLLYDNNYQVYRDVFRFLNYELSGLSYKKQEQSLYAIKLLLTYCEIISIDYKQISLEQSQQLISFIYGRSYSKGHMTYSLLSKRNSDTVNTYLGIYKDFYEYIGLSNSIFHIKKIKHSKRLIGYGKVVNNKEKFLLSEKSIKRNIKIPMYIHPEEFNEIIRVIRKKYTLREELIVRLMYECGLRIGEVFGLTLEDINTEPKVVANPKSQDELGELIIRNRVTDKPFQNAKTCLKPDSHEEELMEAFSVEGVWYQTVNPSILLIKEIERYLDALYGSFEKNADKKNNFKKYSKASKVTSSTYLSSDNYYIFVNNRGKPLTQDAWNKILRKILLEAGLKLDSGKRRHNLNHRFRHGHAMFLKKYLGATRVDIQYALRHTSPRSADIYFRPDEDDIIESKTEAVLSMYEACPLLREIAR